jgi:hypothetical protein
MAPALHREVNCKPNQRILDHIQVGCDDRIRSHDSNGQIGMLPCSSSLSLSALTLTSCAPVCTASKQATNL